MNFCNIMYTHSQNGPHSRRNEKALFEMLPWKQFL